MAALLVNYFCEMKSSQFISQTVVQAAARSHKKGKISHA